MIRSQHRHFVILGLLILLAEWLWVFKGRPSPVHSLPDTVKNKIPDAYKTHIATPNDDIFDYPAVNSKDIRAVCDAAPWRQDLVFTCDNSVGGVGNLKNSFLICVRFSISAGAAMTMPKIIVRDATDIAVIRTGQRTTMDYLFDTGHFVKSLKLSCPQLKLYEDVDSIPNSHAFNRLGKL